MVESSVRDSISAKRNMSVTSITVHRMKEIDKEITIEEEFGYKKRDRRKLYAISEKRSSNK